jgi:hypothetical protein
LQKKFRGAMCEFYEDMTNGYNRYRSAANESHFVGFNRRGRPLRSGLAGHREKCLNFLKFDTEFSINHHNQKLAGGNHSAQVPVHAHRQLLKDKRTKQPRKNASPRLRHRKSKKLS